MKKSNPFAALLDDMQRTSEARARERGFSSVDEMIEHDEAQERERENAARARRLSEHREDVIRVMGGELSARAVASIRSWNIIETAAVKALREWAKSDTPLLVLSGHAGVGKTFASVAYACSREVDVQIIHATRLGAHWERWTSDREDRIEPLRLGADLLIINDLGLEPTEDRRVEAALERIVDARQSPDTRTIFTTNLTKEGAKARGYSERIFSRIAGNGAWVYVTGNDLRRAK